MRKQVQEKQQRTGFDLTYQDIKSHYSIVHVDTLDDDPGIYGSVAGSAAGAYPSKGNASHNWQQQTEEERAKERIEHERIAQEIVSLKPAFIVREISDNPRSVFGDHFAVAMLLSDIDSSINV